ncbi:MAG: glycerate kinase [Syntrophobacteraceae bacterium]
MPAEKRTPARLREDARAIFNASLSAADPCRAVLSSLVRSGDALLVKQGRKTTAKIDLRKVKRILVIGAGKATAPMARAVEEVLGDRIAEGVISVQTGHGLPLKKTAVLEASHPVPGEDGVNAARRIRRLLDGTRRGDLVLSLISGGGSALLPLPADGISLPEKQEVTRMLLACGATIHELNAVRKHLSQVKGGQLARAAAPARVINLVISDVVGDDLDTIASGPFSPDNSTFEAAIGVLTKYGLWNAIPAVVRERMERGRLGEIPDTPKPGDPIFARVTSAVISSNFTALAEARREARRLGYRTVILSSSIEGEARETARVHTAIAREARTSGNPAKPPACILSGGETTVTLKGKGKGGRNQEFALAASLDIAGLEGVLVFSAGTDGSDGPTDAAGAMADGDTCARASEAGLFPAAFLESNDSYHFFKLLGDLIVTGPTRTNVADIRLMLIA